MISEHKELIEKFLMDNDLKKLENRLDQFDLFRVFKISSREITMSAILAWLLDPNESHNLGDYFLKQMLLEIIKQNKGHDYLDPTVFSIINLDILDLDDVYVQTEEVFSNKRRGDISIVDNTNQIYILIENKIFSGEGESQTVSYYQEAQQRYDGYDQLFVYLTPEGDPPKDHHFLPLSYVSITNLLVALMETKQDELSDSSNLVISQMKKNIDDNITEQTLNNLCIELYKKHKTAIDLIIAAKPPTKSYYEQMGKQVIDELGEDWTIKCTNSYCALFKKTWLSNLTPKKDIPIIHYEYNHLGNNNLRTLIHIEPQGNQETYLRLRDEIKKTNVANVDGIIIDAHRSLYSEEVERNIDPMKIDAVLEKGANEMIKLIRKTYSYFDEAVDATSK
jgi:hypothetical protein